MFSFHLRAILGFQGSLSRASRASLTLLGSLQVQNFSSKATDMSLRVASLDYLGVVAARLRKDAVASSLDEETLRQIVDHLDVRDESKKKKRLVGRRLLSDGGNGVGRGEQGNSTRRHFSHSI